MENENKHVLNALIVDDNEVNTVVLANMLELFHITTERTNSGIQAVELLRNKEFDIIFVDHFMPKMDGVQTTIEIRGLKKHQKDLIIIALTSSLTDEVRRLYQYAGANEVYTKPLGLVELSGILKQWCPNYITENLSFELSVKVEKEEDVLVRSIIDEINEIYYEVGLKYAVGDTKHYIDILGVSLKDIRTCMNMVICGYQNKCIEDMRIGVHNIKSVFANIGALNLSEFSKDFELIIQRQRLETVDFYYSHFIDRVTRFYNKLDIGLKKYDRMIKVMIREGNDAYIPMTNEEYEQSICNTIYYIRRYDYVAILKELEDLIKRGHPAYQSELEQAMDEIRSYKYESILSRMVYLKNTIDREKALKK